jgi:uncharacterized protein YbjT (DUF2867 family)
MQSRHRNLAEALAKSLASMTLAATLVVWPALVAMPAKAEQQAGVPPLVLVAGASGQTGRLVLERAAKAGFRVRGMARDPLKAKAEIPGRYEWVAGDVRDPASLGPAMESVTYVVCAVGATERSGPNSPEFVDYGGVKNLVEAAKAAGVRQFALVSSTGAGGGGGAFGWMLNTVLMPGILEWKGKGEQALRASGLAYTILRPGGLTNDRGGQQGIRFTQGDTLGAGTIPRADLAAVAVAALGNEAAIGKTFELAGDDRSPPDGWRNALAALKKD